MENTAVTSLPPVCRILSETANRAADDALLDALPHLGEEEIAPVVAVLLERASTAGLTGLIARFHRFPEPVQDTIDTHVERLYRALSAALRSTTSMRLRTNAVELIHRGNACRTAVLLGTALIDSSHRIRGMAATALCDLAGSYAHREAETLRSLAERTAAGDLPVAEAAARVADLVDERKPVVSALEQALDSFDRHCRTEALESIMQFIPSMGPLVWPRISRPRSRAARAMVELLDREADPRYASFALQALQFSELRSPVAQALVSERSDDFFFETIRCGWLAADPRCRAALQRIRELPWIRSNVDRIASMPEEAQRKAVMLVAALGMPEHTKATILQEFIRVGPAALRRAALWAIVDMDEDTATQILVIVTRWDDDALAPIARRELRRRGVGLGMPETPEPAAPATPHRESDSAEDEPAQVEPTFECFWNRFDDLNDSERLDLLRHCTLHGVNIKAELRKRITQGAPTDQVRAISIAVQAGLIDAYRTEIFALAHDPNALVRAAATSLLAHMPGPTAERMLRAALADEDSRVQANAVQAIDSIGTADRVDLLREKLNAESNRVRANAVGALLRLQVREAAESLLQMFAHPNRAYRLSALWVAESMRLKPLVPRIASMGREDPDAQVRARAIQVAERIEGQNLSPPKPVATAEATS